MRKWWSNLTPAQRKAKTRKRNLQRVRAYDRERGSRNDSNASRTSEQVRARNAVARALRKGDLIRQPCEFINDDCSGRIEAHHDDYDRPLDVHWVCTSHHRMLEGIGPLVTSAG
jgi:hypothetical protein